LSRLLHPDATPSWHLDVGDDYGKWYGEFGGPAQSIGTALPIDRFGDVIPCAAQHAGGEPPERIVVLDEQDRGTIRHGGARGTHGDWPLHDRDGRRGEQPADRRPLGNLHRGDARFGVPHLYVVGHARAGIGHVAPGKTVLEAQGDADFTAALVHRVLRMPRLLLRKMALKCASASARSS
jgi:hypothetical protein